MFAYYNYSRVAVWRLVTSIEKGVMPMMTWMEFLTFCLVFIGFASLFKNK